MTVGEPAHEHLRALLSRFKFHRDVQIPVAVFEEYRDDLHRTDVSWYNSPSYRDGHRFWSVHLTDHRHDDVPRDGIIAHLEWVNPEHHPILHALVGFPHWFFWNRIVMTEPATLGSENDVDADPENSSC